MGGTSKVNYSASKIRKTPKMGSVPEQQRVCPKGFLKGRD